jgi:hypothetical protein
MNIFAALSPQKGKNHYLRYVRRRNNFLGPSADKKKM